MEQVVIFKSPTLYLYITSVLILINSKTPKILIILVLIHFPICKYAWNWNLSAYLVYQILSRIEEDKIYYLSSSSLGNLSLLHSVYFMWGEICVWIALDLPLIFFSRKSVTVAFGFTLSELFIIVKFAYKLLYI